MRTTRVGRSGAEIYTAKKKKKGVSGFEEPACAGARTSE